MGLGLPFFNKTETCQVHGASSTTANRTLLLMIAGSLALVGWHVWRYGPTGHWAPDHAAAIAFPLLLLGEIRDLVFNSHGMLAELWDILPYFVVGLLLGGYLRTYKVAARLQASLRRYGVASIFLASLIGIITPLCACGTLTTAISLLFAGLPLAPVIALLVTSPLLSPSAFLLTLNDLGPEWAAIRTIAAYGMGVFAGLVTHLLRNRGFNTKELFIEGAIIRGDFHDQDYPDERLRCNCREKFGNRVAIKTSNKFLVFLAKSAEMCWPVGKYIVVGVAVGSIVERYMPYQWIYQLFGSNDPLSIVWVTLGSVPLFLHQISASSILAHIKTSLHGTLDAGAALAFIVGGPVTAVPTLALFWSVFKRRVFILYLTICIIGTLLIAYGAKVLVFVPGVDLGNPILKGVSQLSGGASSVIEKKGADVRIVLDINGKSTLAVADNDAVIGQGGKVFDAAILRLKNSEHLDNLLYFSNIAQWLQESVTTSDRKILIYHLSNRIADSYNYEPLQATLKGHGFATTITDRGNIRFLTGRYMADFGQVWIVFDDTTGNQLSKDEIDAVCNFSAAGRGILIIAGAGEGLGHDMAAINQLASKLGASFTGYYENQKESKIGKVSGFLTDLSAVISRVLKIFHKA